MSPESAEPGGNLGPKGCRFPGHLPLPLTPLLAREREIAEIVALLHRDGVRLATLTGPGGVGKTRLALAAARSMAPDFADGVAFVGLAPVRDPALVVPAVAQALGVRDTGTMPVAAALAAAVGEAEALLVLDNLEHVLDAVPFVADLLGECPRLRVLATSRAPLHITGEHEYPVAPLALPDPGATTVAAVAGAAAVRLFAVRAAAVDPGFTIGDANAAAVAAVCARLDGLPLAIELAAARSKVLPPAQLLPRLAQRLPLLTDGPRDVPERLRTMRDAIAWSHDLLSPDEQRLFRRLAVFVGGFDLDAAAAVWPPGSPPCDTVPDPPLLATLAGLIDASLVRRVDGDGGEPRFAMLETVREFALERLAASGERNEVDDARARYVMRLVETGEPAFLGSDERWWQARLDADLENIRAALAWAVAEAPAIALRIGGSLWVYWFWRGLAGEGSRWLTAALASDGGEPIHRAKALTTAAAMAVTQGDVAASEPLAAEAAALAHDLGEPVLEAHARWLVAARLLFEGALADAAGQLDATLALYRAATAPTDVTLGAYVRAYRGLVAAGLGDPDAAIGHYEAALADVRRLGSRFAALLILDDFAGLLLERNEVARARALLGEALDLAVDCGGVWPGAHTLLVLAAVDALDGRSWQAGRRLGAGEEMLRRFGLTPPPALRQRADRTAAMLALHLGPAEFARAQQQGCNDPDAVVAAALAESGRGAGAAAGRRAGDAPALSPRELQVLDLLAQGLTDREIAAAFSLSRKTASNHVASILAKLGVRTRGAAVAIALARRPA